jgi:hypothetical protein
MDGRADKTLPYLDTSALKLKQMSVCGRSKKLLSASVYMSTMVSKEDTTKGRNGPGIRTVLSEA